MKKGSSVPNSMDLLEFMERFSTEEACREHLFKKRFASGFVCPKCNHKHGVTIKSRMLMQCSLCGHQISAMNGTLMHDTKMPIRKWYLAIYLITSSKRGISAKELQRQIGVTYKTAWYVNKRIRAAMSGAEKKYDLSGTVTMDESYFSGRETSQLTALQPKKRGRGTDKSKVIIAVSLDNNKYPLYAKMSVVDNFKAKTIAEFAAQNIKKSATIVTDGFKSYKAQILKKDYFHEFENFDQSNEKSSLKWLHIIISNAKAFIGGTFHGLHRQELQTYLDEFCYRFNRRHIPHLVFDKLIHSTFIVPPIKYYAKTVVMG